MYKITHPLFLLCETPLHAGSGDDLGIVDLPIQRERHTSFPKIEASSLKGALREAFEERTGGFSGKFESWNATDVKIHRIFGFDGGALSDEKVKQLKGLFKRNNEDASEFAGSLAFSDARLLLFPVKSMKGVFVWVTCPQVLNKFATDLTISKRGSIESLDAIKTITIDAGKCNVASSSVTINNSVVLEEFAFSAIQTDAVKDFAATLADLIFDHPSLTYWNGLLKSNLIVLRDEDFRDFVNQSTEIITRTKIDNHTGTVQDGALFTEEYLPTDSVLYSLVMASNEYSKKEEKMDAGEVIQFFVDHQPEIFQLGGNASIGKGLLRTKLLTD